jgi:hypothetical protein
MRRSSWPPLLVAAAVFAALFTWQRLRSPFLAVEARAAVLAPAAQAHGLDVAEAMALAAMLPRDAAPTLHAEAMRVFAADRVRLGDGLAAVAMFGDRERAEAARREAADPVAAWLAFRAQPEALPGLRFLALRDRFASRRPRE